MAIAQNRDLAEFITGGLHGQGEMNAADQLRLEQLLRKHAWAAFHIWDRTQRGIFPKGTFELTGGALLCGVLRTARGGAWWRSAKHTGFIPEFVADVDASSRSELLPDPIDPISGSPMVGRFSPRAATDSPPTHVLQKMPFQSGPVFETGTASTGWLGVRCTKCLTVYDRAGLIHAKLPHGDRASRLEPCKSVAG